MIRICVVMIRANFMHMLMVVGTDETRKIGLSFLKKCCSKRDWPASARD